MCSVSRCRLAPSAVRLAVSGSPAWTEVAAGNLRGKTVIGPSPGLLWVHGLGGSCAADELRGVGELLNPRILGRTVLRLDLRGHGLSAAAHDASRGAEQYQWEELAKDVRVAGKAALSRSFFGGEAMGAAIMLHAALSAISSGSIDAPPALVLMRPPNALANSSSKALIETQPKLTSFACAAETGEWGALELLEEVHGSIVDGAHVIYCQNQVTPETLLAERRHAISSCALGAVLRGHLASVAPGGEVRVLGEQRRSMAADAYGVLTSLQCPTLILAVPGDPEHTVEAAECLAASLPNSELVVADDSRHASSSWPQCINTFLRRAWMKEFLEKRVMPQ